MTSSWKQLITSPKEEDTSIQFAETTFAHAVPSLQQVVPCFKEPNMCCSAVVPCSKEVIQYCQYRITSWTEIDQVSLHQSLV